MFDFLKKKIGGFIDGLTKKEEEKEAEEEMEDTASAEKELQENLEKETREQVPAPGKAQRAQPEVKAKNAEKSRAAPPAPRPEKKKTETAQRKKGEPNLQVENLPAGEENAPTHLDTKQPKKPEPEQKTEPVIVSPAPQPKAPEMPPRPKAEKSAGPEAKPEPEKARIRLNPLSAITSIITSEVEIKDSEVRGLLDSLELELLESDVEMGVAEGIRAELSGKLIGAKVKRGELHSFVGRSIRETLSDVLRNEKSFDIVQRVESSEKPVRIMFVGINGAGKTTDHSQGGAPPYREQEEGSLRRGRHVPRGSHRADGGSCRAPGSQDDKARLRERSDIRGL